MYELWIEVFTSRNCPHCPAAVEATKKLLKENPGLREKVKWKQMDTSTREGGNKADKYGIRTVPTIILTNKNGEKGGLRGAPSQRKYLETVHEMLGWSKPEEPGGQRQGFLKRLLGWR